MKVKMILGMVALFIGATASAQTDTTGQTGVMGSTGNSGRIGKMTIESFNSTNAKGNEMVSSITPTATKLSAADKQLMMKVAAGGQRQLALSQAIVDKATNEQVKLLAASEVEEQTGVAAKLKEIADAKGVTLPDGPDAAAQALVTKAQNMSGDQLDAFYINESGIKGHELLQATMTTVNNTAKDESLKKLASATMPVIKMHLTVSKDVKGMMTGMGAKSKAAIK
jgi:putative membrane protein